LTERQKKVRKLVEELAATSESIGDEAVAALRRFRWELPGLLEEEDVPLLASIITAEHYLDLCKGPRGRTGWQPEIYVSKAEHRRLQIQKNLAAECGKVFAEYYVRTNSPGAQRVFLEMLKGYDSAHLGTLDVALLTADRATSTRLSYNVPNPDLLTKTDWAEVLHREYLGFERLEASIEAARYLFWSEKYRPEAVWFFCRILADPKMVTTQHAVDQVKYLLGFKRTRRQDAIINAYEAFSRGAVPLSDRQMLVDYLLPWAKHIRATEEKRVWWFVVGDLRTRVPIRTDIDFDKIKAGTPVPPKPATVIENPGQ